MSSIKVEVDVLHGVIFLVVVDKLGVDAIDNFRVELTFLNEEEDLKKELKIVELTQSLMKLSASFLRFLELDLRMSKAAMMEAMAFSE